MAEEGRRAVLEAIAYGSDPKVTPGDRLRALEMLRQDDEAAGRLDDDVPIENVYAELDECWTGLLIGEHTVAPSRMLLDPAHFPRLLAAMRRLGLPPREEPPPPRHEAADVLPIVDAEVVEEPEPAAPSEPPDEEREPVASSWDPDEEDDEDAPRAPVGLLTPPGIDPDAGFATKPNRSVRTRRHRMLST